MLTLFKQEPRRSEDVPLDQQLIYLIRYGKPRLSYISNGWYCKVEMNTNTQGTQFDVASDFDHGNPLSAVKQCHERIQAAMKQLGL